MCENFKVCQKQKKKGKKNTSQKCIHVGQRQKCLGLPVRMHTSGKHEMYLFSARHTKHVEENKGIHFRFRVVSLLRRKYFFVSVLDCDDRKF